MPKLIYIYLILNLAHGKEKKVEDPYTIVILILF